MSSSTSSSERRYLVFLALFAVPLFLLLGLNELFLTNAGELTPIPQILALQQDPETFCLYGTALYGDTFRYKMEALALRKPEIIVIGSSRMLQLRERFFARPFYNLSNTISNLNEGRDVVEGILMSPHKPKIVIFGIDFWWFNGSYIPPVPYRPRSEPLHQFEGYFLFKPFLWLKEGKITPTDYVHTMLRPAARDTQCNIGIQALKRRSGFASDGSQYPFIDPDPDYAPDRQEHPFGEIKQISAGVDRYTYADTADPRHMQAFLQLIEKLRKANIEVIALLPPFAESVADALEQEKAHYGIFDDLKSQIRAAGVFLLDATDPAFFGSSNCEFIDGVHPGDVTMARLLLALNRERQRAGLAPIGNTEVLRRTVEENAGLAMARDARVTTAKEGDFLHIGCAK
ncbi:MAG: hypothetical protein PHX93_06205 [Candidatus Peribacteraceae bacterium]|jgi:hypothetical protein|nr:hypothetical protein [Candidatus Peribacteraceae bacterium]